MEESNRAFVNSKRDLTFRSIFLNVILDENQFEAEASQTNFHIGKVYYVT